MSYSIKKEELSENKYNKVIVEVPVQEISTLDINPRKSGLILENVENLIKTNGEFPEIHLGLFENQLVIIDGWHRYTAAKRLDLSTINAFVIEYNSLEEMKIEAFKTNVNHGIKLTDLDVALNLYDFYKFSLGVNPNTKIKTIANECDVNYRKARRLIFHIIINQEILERPIENIENYSKSEEYYKIFKLRNENINSPSEEFKREITNFILKYESLDRTSLRLAVNAFVEGKDYFEEMEKSNQEVEAMEENDRLERQSDFEVISKEDLIDRNANIANTDTINPIIKDLEEKQEEVVSLNNIPPLQEKLMSLNSYIAATLENVKRIKMYYLSDSAEMSKSNYQDIVNLKLSFDEIIDYYKEKNNVE